MAAKVWNLHILMRFASVILVEFLLAPSINHEKIYEAIASRASGVALTHVNVFLTMRSM